MNPDFWRGRRVFLTGHTGFKGSWLSIWLQSAGAEVHGFSSAPPTEPNLFGVARVADRMAAHSLGDVRDASALRVALNLAKPEVVFHLAAQPLVRYSYAEPVETYAVNVMGTVNLFEAVRACGTVRSVVNVTTDKCYENKEWAWGYRESEAMGGHDPYASSKACSEMVTAAYRRSFLAQKGVAVASARAGNVIGGGDWALDRLIPDVLRALDRGTTLEIRHPGAIRPWQHVLEPLAGYLLLAEQLALAPEARATGWNFGSADDDARSVEWILRRMQRKAPELKWSHIGGEHVHEAHYLKLDSAKAQTELGWRRVWNLDTALEKTLEWHFAWNAGEDMREFCLSQIRDHALQAEEFVERE